MSDKKYELTRRRILGGLTAAGAASAAAGAGTFALFSDTESSTNNTVTAGTLNLDADEGNSTEGDDSATTTLSVTGAAPGDSGTQAETLANTGNVDGIVSLKFGRGENKQGTPTDPEPSSAQPGDLGDVLVIEVFVGSESIRRGTFNAVFDGTREFYQTPPLDGDATKDLQIYWKIPLWAGNHIQTDEVLGDIEITLLQDEATIEHFADVVVEGGDQISTVVDNEASDGDTVLVRDTYDNNYWNPIKKSVTLVSESSRGASVGRLSVKAPDVGIIGFDVEGDGENYNGISVEPNNGADSGVVIRDNYIHGLTGTGKGDDGGTNDGSDKNETYGVLAWASDTVLKDLVVARNEMDVIGGYDSTGSWGSQGFGVFLEGLSFNYRGATIENNDITNVGGYDQDGNHFPGVGVAVQPELTDPDASTADSGINTDKANATLWNNTVGNTEIGVSLAGKIKQMIVANNSLSVSDYQILTEGNSSIYKGNIGITDLDEGTVESVVEGTARYLQ